MHNAAGLCHSSNKLLWSSETCESGQVIKTEAFRMQLHQNADLPAKQLQKSSGISSLHCALNAQLVAGISQQCLTSKPGGMKALGSTVARSSLQLQPTSSACSACCAAGLNALLLLLPLLLLLLLPPAGTLFPASLVSLLLLLLVVNESSSSQPLRRARTRAIASAAICL
jgi:hypothetical protein